MTLFYIFCKEFPVYSSEFFPFSGMRSFQLCSSCWSHRFLRWPLVFVSRWVSVSYLKSYVGLGFPVTKTGVRRDPAISAALRALLSYVISGPSGARQSASIPTTDEGIARAPRYWWSPEALPDSPFLPPRCSRAGRRWPPSAGEGDCRGPVWIAVLRAGRACPCFALLHALRACCSYGRDTGAEGRRGLGRLSL